MHSRDSSFAQAAMRSEAGLPFANSEIKRVFTVGMVDNCSQRAFLTNSASLVRLTTPIERQWEYCDSGPHLGVMTMSHHTSAQLGLNVRYNGV